MTVPCVAVIVLSHNKMDMLRECLDHLQFLDYPNYHVTVVDNASRDGSVEMVKKTFPEADLVENKVNVGAVEGRNQGVAFAVGKRNYDFLLFLDDDAIARPDSLSRAVGVMQKRPDVGFVCGKTYTDLKLHVLMSAGVHCRFELATCYDRGAGQEDKAQYNRYETVDACGAFAFLMRYSLFEKLKGFDPLYSPYGWEDIDLCLRGRQQGFATFYDPHATFIHRGTRIGRKPIPDYERTKVRNFLILFNRHATPTQKLLGIVFFPARGFWLILRFLSTRNANVVSSLFRGFYDFFEKK